MNELLDKMILTIVHYVLPFLALILLTVSIFYILQKMRKNVRLAHDIAVIGFPQSGKTTFITTLFEQILYNSVLDINIDIRGATIERINEDIEKIKIGKLLGTTTDQDVFPYRFDMPKRNFFERPIKVQIGDFKGENSESFCNNFGPWLHKTPFFKWIMQADSFIFVIDIANVLLNNVEYRALMIKSITAAWQNIAEYHIESKKRVHKKSVCIAFTKSDLLLQQNNSEVNKIKTLGFEEYPEKIEINSDIELNTSRIEENFSELKIFFNKRKINLKFFFVSCFIYDKSEKSMLGMKEIINHSLACI